MSLQQSFITENVYALGVTCIEFIQCWFADYEDYFEMVNNLASPTYALDVLFPVVSAVDSVFAAQLLLCTAFGSWMNAVMKWWFLDDRPYWWVNETSYYTNYNRPRIQQTAQTCETGPGFPSGHTTSIAMLVMLVIMWIAHIINDRKWKIWWWKLVLYPLAAIAVFSVALARMYVAAHFPHQCLFGALIGFFLAPALCIFVTDPYIWRTYGEYPHARMWHILSALTSAAVAFTTYWSLKLLGIDPYYTVELAHRHCRRRGNIHVSTTPLYALVNSTGSLLGCALALTPDAKHYRHYTSDRSIIIAGILSYAFTFYANAFKRNLDFSNDYLLYAIIFITSAIKPLFYLRAIPKLATLPYTYCCGDKASASKRKVE